MDILTSEEAKRIELSWNPFRRSKQLRELAAPVGGLALNHGSISGAVGIPTRRGLVSELSRHEYDKGVAQTATDYGIQDERVAKLVYENPRYQDILNDVRPGSTS